MSQDEEFQDNQESEQELLNDQVMEQDMTISGKPKISTWDKLATVNVNENTEKKGNLTYLSWAWAWGITKKLCPDANYKTVNFDGKPYLFDEHFGIMVQTEVTIDGETIPMHLFVMDHSNKAQKHVSYTYKLRNGSEKTCEAATMFDINTAIMRCLAKNIAMHGLGHYIYAGHDLPPAPEFDYSTIQPSIDAIIKGIAENNLSSAREAWDEMTQDERNASWVAKSKGGSFNTAEKKVLQSTEFREAGL